MKSSRTSLKANTCLQTKTQLKSKQKGAKVTPGEYFSIFGDVSICAITKEKERVVVHHIFGGPYKAKSEKYGFVIALRSDYHTGTSYAVHEDIEFSNRLKRTCEEYAINNLGMTKEDFASEFGKNYL